MNQILKTLKNNMVNNTENYTMKIVSEGNLPTKFIIDINGKLETYFTIRDNEAIVKEIIITIWSQIMTQEFVNLEDKEILRKINELYTLIN